MKAPVVVAAAGALLAGPSPADPIDAALDWHDHMATVVRQSEQQAQERAQEAVTTSRALPRSGPSASQWAALRSCEAGGDYSINTGNGYYGAYQFDLTTWRGVGGTGYPHQASPAEQDYRAALLYADRGAAPWPYCGRYLP